MADRSFDFIVVGGGTAGALLASQLAKTKSQPSVLLVEAGGDNASPAVKIDAERWLNLAIPEMNWKYKTEPIPGFEDRPIDYDRGKGLGGSSAINFACWTIGSKGDHDEIARIVGDDEWSWKNAQERFKRIESFDDKITPGLEKYTAPRRQDHGYEGPIKVGFPLVLEPSAKAYMDIWLANGYKINLDSNNGDPIGLSSVWSTMRNGLRSTSADALAGVGPNLQVLTHAQVARVLFDGLTATAIETTDGRRYSANKEIILSAGSLDTPRLLLHSGIGPSDQLEEFNIPIVKANANVGQHLKDHHHIVLSYEQADHTTQRHKFYSNKELQAAARQQWEKDGTGPLSEFATSMGIGFQKFDWLYESKEFQALPLERQRHLKEPTVAHAEFIINGVHLDNILNPGTPRAGTSIFLFLFNAQSEGEVRLQSSDPSIPLKFQPNFFSHPYDRKVAVGLTRETLKVVNSPEFQRDTIGVQAAPASDSEEDILDFWKKTSGSTWHISATARMGKTERDSVVDPDFKVFGVKNLRVADLSVVPIIVNNHTQSTAYLAGLIAADKLVAEYGLDS